MENAFVMDPFSPDAYLVPEAEIAINGAVIGLQFSHSFPIGQRIAVNNNEQVGEFLYSIALSSDLQEFETGYAVDLGSLAVTRETIPLMSFSTRAQKVTLEIFPSYRTSHPKSFGRLQVRRLKRDYFVLE